MKLSVMDIFRFGQDCFHTPSAEESIVTCCGSKNHFKNTVSFWLHALFAEDWTSRENYFASYAESGLCVPISCDAFYGMINECSNWLRPELPTFLLDREDLLCAWKMYDDWTILRLLRNVAATSLRSNGKQQPDVAEQSREPEHAIRRLEMEAVLARARLRQVVIWLNGPDNTRE